jgi:hypothetical protein
MYNRAVLLERDGRLTEAEEMQRKCLQLRQKVLGEDHQQVLNRHCVFKNRSLDHKPPADTAKRSGIGKFGRIGWRRGRRLVVKHFVVFLCG